MRCYICHNPYFNRWFSAIHIIRTGSFGKKCHNPYFNRWFSAIIKINGKEVNMTGHNPYFNRWFSAIPYMFTIEEHLKKSQSLF